MPSSAHQSSARLVEAAAAGPLAQPSNVAVLMLTLTDPGGDVNFNADYTGLAGLAFRVIDVWLVKVVANNGVGDTYRLQTAAGAANVTDAIAGVNDTLIARAGEIDDANDDFAAGAGLRVAVVDGAADGLSKSAVMYVEIALT